MENIPPFYVGQKVVSLVGAAHQIITKGNTYTVFQIRQFSCGCWVVDVGLSVPKSMVICSNHQNSGFETGCYRWIDSSLFAPINENFQHIELEKVLEIETKLIGVN